MQFHLTLLSAFLFTSVLGQGNILWKGTDMVARKIQIGGSDYVIVNPVKNGVAMQDVEFTNVDVTRHRPKHQYAAEISDWVLEQGLDRKGNTSILLLGVGGGAIPHMLYHRCPRCMVTALDISADSIRIAQEIIQPAKLPWLRCIQADAQDWVSKSAIASYDIVICDIYAAENTESGGPAWVKGLKFTQQVHRLMKPGGIYIINVFEPVFSFEGGHSTGKNILRHVFGHPVISTAFRMGANTLLFAFKKS